jgi:hypothetical protein
VLPNFLLSCGIRFLLSVIVLAHPVGGNSTAAATSIPFMALTHRLFHRHNKTVFALETVKRRRENQVVLVLHALDNVMDDPLVMDLIINEKTAVPGGLLLTQE